MKLRVQWLGPLLVALLPAQGVAQSAQERDSIEPRVSTSSVAQPQPPSPAQAAPPGAPGKATEQPAGPKPSAAAAKAPAKAAAPAPARANSGKANDRLELDPTQISGNRELPRVMYVVPWRRPDVGEFAGRPPNSLLDEVLAPVDRDVFRRQNRYYTALQPDTSAAASKDEK